uniref:Uncharacterized protein n=1 Tax=Aegilops tauschii TaxID=37682 RepID=N1QUA6_AEGTA
MEQELRSGGAVRAQSTLCFSGALVDGPRIQQLLLHCAAALESNDVTLAQQAMWVLNNIASAQGDPNQRLTSSLLRGLEIGLRLANFAKSKGVHLEFNVVNKSTATSPPSPAKLQTLCQELACVLSDPSALRLRDGEALVVNCQSWLRHVAPGSRDGFVDAVRALGPCLVTVTDEDADLDSPSLATRIAGCFNFHWILFDALDTSAPRDSPRRLEHEAAVGQKIESVPAPQGPELSESGARLGERMRRKGFAGVGFGEDEVAEVRHLLSEHATGWGVKREEDMLVLTWKGHAAVFTTAWAPN